MDSSLSKLSNGDRGPGQLNRESFAAFRNGPARFLTDAINQYVRTAPTNWSAPFGHPLFSAPVAIAFADGDSERFLEIKRKWPWTLTPREALDDPPRVAVATVSGAPKSRVDMPGLQHLPLLTADGHVTWPGGPPPAPPWPEVPGNPDQELRLGPPPLPASEHVTCIAIGLPIHAQVLKAETSYPWGNSPELKVHSLCGSHLGFGLELTLFVVRTLQMFGFAAISPGNTTWGSEFTMDFQYEGSTSRQPISPCPEREWSYAAGLGTFGLSDMLITEKGMAVMLCLVMTSAVIPDSPRPAKEHCLFLRDGSCRKCVERCPGQAISSESDPPGRSSARCHAGSCAAARYNETHLRDRMLRELGDYAGMGGNITWDGAGMARDLILFPSCGRCYTDVPCSTRIPD